MYIYMEVVAGCWRMIYIDMHKCLDLISDYGPGHNYRTEAEEYERTVGRTVPCCSIIPVSSERWKKNLVSTYS